jgi:hypothetical protein
MSKIVIALALACALAWPAYADLTIRTVTRGPLGGDAPSVSYIKGTKMRTDVTISGVTRSMIIDATTRQMIVLDPDVREATVYDVGRMADQMQKEAGAGVQGAKVSMTPNGETKELLGRTCTGYNVSITVPVSMGPNTVTLNIGGPVWIAKDAPGTSDFATFYKAASENGLFFGAPAGRGGPAGMNERGMALMYRALADAGGLPYEQEITVKTDTTGPGADMMRRAGPGTMTATTSVTSVSTDSIPADRFEIPAGYTKKTQ